MPLCTLCAVIHANVLIFFPVQSHAASHVSGAESHYEYSAAMEAVREAVGYVHVIVQQNTFETRTID